MPQKVESRQRNIDAGSWEKGWVLCYASDELKADKELVLKAAKTDGQILYYVSKELRDDYDVVLETVKIKV